MRDTNYDVAEAGVGARGGAAQGAGPRQDDGGHRHPRSQLNNILHFAVNSLLWIFGCESSPISRNVRLSVHPSVRPSVRPQMQKEAY